MNIAVLGSTGSIGTQALNVIKNNKDKFNAFALSAHGNIALIKKQLTEFKPHYCVITDLTKKHMINPEDFPNTKIMFGAEYLTDIAVLPDIDVVLSAVTGLNALEALTEAIKSNKRIALADKEIMVCAGEYITDIASKYNCKIIPVDSEHSAIFQCIEKDNVKNVKNIILTASGGPFRDFSFEDLTKITPEMALRHPTWNMGKKITIDCATLMNKGLEVIEAKWLFGLQKDNIRCIMHPQSIIHSMVEFTDNSVIAQLSYPSMEIPIQLAFTYPYRIPSSVPSLDFAKLKNLEFRELDTNKFPCLGMAYEALERGGLQTTVLNAANDCAVNFFLDGKITFTDIPLYIEKAFNKFDISIKNTLENINYIEKEVKKYISSLLN